ncbi:MAG: diguanylate cyclase [Candidatus Paracaedibacteraceae bacterium]|nr:diguanylate cyclase [Candidatus Paracaedibacteraceae bacterium]
MKFFKARNLYILIGLILSSIGLTVATGWILSNKSLITLFTNQNPLEFIGLFSVMFSGIFFCLKGGRQTPLLLKLAQASAITIIAISFLICILTALNFSLYTYLFPDGEFYSYFHKTKYSQPHLMWLIAGGLLFKSTQQITNRQLSYLETINFILLFFAILGIILSFHEFTLIYTWLNQFSMPLAYSIALTLINIGMIVSWGDVRQSNSSQSSEEDRQIRFFSVSMLTQAIMSAVFFGATLLASQNEFFLKTSLEKYTALKSVVLNQTISNEINEIIHALEAIDSSLEAQEKFKIDNKVIQDLDLLRKSQNFNALKITTLDHQILSSQGAFIESDQEVLNIKAQVDTKLLRNKQWYIHFKAPILVNGQSIGVLEVQKPLDGFNQTIANNNKFSFNEEQYICAYNKGMPSPCLSFLGEGDSKEKNMSSALFDGSTPLGSVFLSTRKIGEKTVSIVEDLPGLGLRFLVRLNVSEIENVLLNRLYIALPIIILFIFFFVRMLNWHILPIFRRSIKAEKDAVESALMVMESESRIRTIMDNIGECVIVFLANGKIESMNLTALQTFNYDNNTAQSLNLLALLDVKIRDMTQFISTNLSQEIEIKGIRSDNTTFDAQIKFKDLTIRQRQLYIAIIRDVTAQKQFEHRLSQSEKVFRNSFDHAPIGMMVLDIKNKITQVNQALCTMLGYHELELKGTNLKKILPENLRLENTLPFVKLIEMGMKNFIIESPLLTKSGDIIQTVSTVTLFVTAARDESFFVGQIEDVTMRQRYEQELKEANTELEHRFKELEVHTSITEDLNTMNGILQSCLTIAEALAPIEKFAKKFFHLTPGALYLTSPETGHMELAVRWESMNFNAEVIRKEECWALRRSQAYTVNNAKEEICCHHYENAIISGHMCIPLTAQGDLIGLLTLYYNEEDFTSHLSSLKRLALSFSDHIALSLSNIRLREKLQRQSISDPLTNLHNRRYFDENMQMELLRAERKGSALSLLIIDIDHFKLFNDTYGHDLGDTVLQEVSTVMKKHIRETDSACRMGGEEFAIILPETPPDIAFERAEELRQAINRIIIKNMGHILEPITVSMGIATYPNHASTVKSLTEAADIALYQAKHQGRNRTVISSHL